MLRKILIVLLLVLGSSTGHAATDWLGINTKNNIPAWTAAALIVADWGTTLDIEDHREVHEENSTLGPHPTRGAINKYFISKLALHWLINQYKPARNIWNIQQVAISAKAVHGNWSLGLRLNF